MKIALGQINPTVGDFSGNAAKIIDFAGRARTAGAGLILFPELSVCGYPPRDLVERPSFVARNRETAERIAAETRGIAVICGLVTPAHAETGKSVMNSAALLKDGAIAFLQSKMLLPTYDVFDEMRNFAPARSQALLPFAGKQMALTICEDAWNDKHFWNQRLYTVDPVESLVQAGGNFVLNISASPFWMGKRELRREMLATIARQDQVPVVMVNQVGGNDSLVFDGSSLALNCNGDVIAQGKSFEEDLVYFDSELLTGEVHPQIRGEEASAYAALVLGTRDYVRKCGFRARDHRIERRHRLRAHGLHRGRRGRAGKRDWRRHARTLFVAQARSTTPGPWPDNLGIRFELLCITDIFESYRKTLQKVFAGCKEDTTEENIQARTRGALLMALSNKFGAIVLSTGNKSELGVGYCTLYGDMVGGLAVISDVPKTLVYRLSHYVNSRRAVIPQATLEKPPSAELRPDQKDIDSLPPYDVLDTILEDYVEDLHTAEQIAADHDYDLALVRKVIQHGRRRRIQAPAGGAWN